KSYGNLRFLTLDHVTAHRRIKDKADMVIAKCSCFPVNITLAVLYEDLDQLNRQVYMESDPMLLAIKDTLKGISELLAAGGLFAEISAMSPRDDYEEALAYEVGLEICPEYSGLLTRIEDQYESINVGASVYRKV